MVEAKPVDVYLNFTKAFDNVSHSILIEKLTAYILDGCKNWLARWPREGWAMSPKGKETREDLESNSCEEQLRELGLEIRDSGRTSSLSKTP